MKESNCVLGKHSTINYSVIKYRGAKFETTRAIIYNKYYEFKYTNCIFNESLKSNLC